MEIEPRFADRARGFRTERGAQGGEWFRAVAGDGLVTVESEGVED